MIAKTKHLIYSKKKKREREREKRNRRKKMHSQKAFSYVHFLDFHASVNAFSKFHAFKHAY